MPHRDRQEFEKTVLPNGITLYTYQLDSPIACMEIQLPVGAAHSHESNGFLPGSVHFLEHLQVIRSHAFPKPHQLNRELGLRGGHFNASTFRSKTSYWIDAPVAEIEFASQALLDRVYHPVFTTEDIERERNVIINEREKEKFYPGHSKSSQYYRTEFMYDLPYPLEQLYGSDDSLQELTPDKLRSMHRIITSGQNTVAIAVGNSDFGSLKSTLGSITTQPGLLHRHMHDTRWTDRTFRLVAFDDVTRPTLEVAWIHPRVTQKERTGIEFLLGALTNNIHGSLFEELRHKRGWVYNLRHFIASHKQTMFGLSIPVTSVKHIEALRDIIHERIVATSNDQAKMELEIRRRLNNQIYRFQTATSIMQQASNSLIGSKLIHNERDWEEAIAAMANQEWRNRLLEQFFKKEQIGEIGFIPA